MAQQSREGRSRWGFSIGDRAGIEVGLEEWERIGEMWRRKLEEREDIEKKKNLGGNL